jgi:hypothetical protein
LGLVRRGRKGEGKKGRGERGRGGEDICHLLFVIFYLSFWIAVRRFSGMTNENDK